MFEVSSLTELFAQCRAAGVTRIRMTADSVEVEWGRGQEAQDKPRPVVPEPVSAMDLAMDAPDIVPAVEPPRG